MTWTDLQPASCGQDTVLPAEYAHANFGAGGDYCAALASLAMQIGALPTVVEFTRLYHFQDPATSGSSTVNWRPTREIFAYWDLDLHAGNEKANICWCLKEVSSSHDNEGEGRVGGWVSGHPGGSHSLRQISKNRRHR